MELTAELVAKVPFVAVMATHDEPVLGLPTARFVPPSPPPATP